MQLLQVLRSPLLVTDYAELGAQCVSWSKETRCVAVEFVNTHIVTMCRHDAAFRELMKVYDYLVPDGMPLVWCLNRAGAKLRDRVYGPTFMREFLKSAPADSTHYLLGGSEECGVRLRENFLKGNPRLNFVGGFHGQCASTGRLESEADDRVIEEINRLSPDFIWVGLGTPKQQAWTKLHKDRIRRGVILTVGFAFDANAGLKSDAPLWMQKRGLTWLHRLGSEPRRLGSRYFKYNLLFLFYLIRDGLRGNAWGSVKVVQTRV